MHVSLARKQKTLVHNAIVLIFMNANEFVGASRYAKVSPCSFFGDIEHRVARVTIEHSALHV